MDTKTIYKLTKENRDLLYENRDLLKENVRLEKELGRLKEREQYVQKEKKRLASAINYVSYIQNRYSDFIGDRIPITDDTSITDLPISVRTKNSLRGNDINTYGELSNLSRRAMITFRNFGRKSLEEVENVLDNIENIKL